MKKNIKRKLIIAVLLVASIIAILLFVKGCNKNTYTIIFKDYDGTILQETTVKEGEIPTFDGIIARENDNNYEFKFVSWDKEIVEAYEDKEYIAVYESILINSDKNKETKTPKSETEVINFDDGIANDTENKEEVKEVYYWVNFLDDDGTVLQRTTVLKDSMPTFNGSVADKIKGYYKYSFKGWDKAFEAVKSTQTYTATYDESLIIDMPKKGDLITLNDNKKYRVLKTNETEAFVLAMDNASDSLTYWDKESNQTTDGFGKEGTKYEGSNVDNFLENTWYANLESSQPEMYGAIKPVTIYQNMYEYHVPYPVTDIPEDYFAKGENPTTTMSSPPPFDPYYISCGHESVLVGQRHVYALGLEDIVDYVGKDNLKKEDLRGMYFESSTDTTYTTFWLNSAYEFYKTASWQANFKGNNLIMNYTYLTCAVRPSFVIDLAANGVEFTIN